MPLTFFPENDSKGDGSKQFLNEWLEENKNNKQKEFEIIAFTRVKSGKGYLVETDCFLAFMWKNQSLTKMLLEALEVYVNEPNKGRKLFVVLKNPKKQDFTLAADMDVEITWFNSGNGYTTLESDVSLQGDSTGNPLIPS